MRELGDDVTHSLTDRQTQPFIVKDVTGDLLCTLVHYNANAMQFYAMQDKT